MVHTASWIERLFDGSFVAGGIFLVIGIIGAVLLLISLLLDGIFEAFDFGDGPLSLTTIAAFATIFGFASFASIGAGASTSIASLVGAGAGLVGVGITWWLTRVIRGAESNTAVSSDELVGAVGSVVLAIPEGGLGEIALVRHGERISLAASSSNAIARGVSVRVIQMITSTSVLVQPTEIPDLPAPPAAH